MNPWWPNLPVLVVSAASTALLPAAVPAAGVLQSGESRERATVRFANDTGNDVQLFWIDFQGERKPYGTLAPGTRRTVETFVSHPWLATDARGRELGLYWPMAWASEAAIQPRLAPRAATLESTLHSKESKDRSTIRFVNHTAGMVHLYWLDYQGRRNLRARVAPEAAERLKTFATHPWVATDVNGKVLALFVATSGDSTALISTGSVP
jgi:hypothetical protein